MNTVRGKTEFAPDEILELQRRLAAYKEEQSLSWTDLARVVGVAAGTLSNWVPGKYTGDNARIADEVRKFFDNEEARLQLALEAPVVPGFQPTTTSRRIKGVLQWAHRGKCSVIVGEAGVGKTTTFLEYAENTPNAWRVPFSRATSRPPSALMHILRTVAPNQGRSYGSLTLILDELARQLAGKRALVICDEANHLEDTALDQIRFLNDEYGIGIVFGGNPKVLARIQGGARHADFAQLYSRMSFCLHIKRSDLADINMLLDAWEVTNLREREFLTGIARQHGALRQMSHTLEIATLFARQSGEERSLSHLKDSWTQQARGGAAA